MAWDGNIRIFISCVSDEFRDYRDQLRRDLTRHNVEVKVQEDFLDFGTVTLDKLDRYVANCHATVHLVGDMTGAMARPRSVEIILSQYTDLADKLSQLGKMFGENEPISYTQWEAWLALYHGKTLLIAAPHVDAPRGPSFAADDESRTRQAAHLGRLRLNERYPCAIFRSPDDLAKQILKTAILDLLAEAQASQRKRKPNTLPYSPLGALFKGRETFMEELRQILGDPKEAKAAAVTGKALHGLGGIGKTRLAVEYAHRHGDAYTALLFVSAETPQQLAADLAQMVGPLVFDLPQKAALEDEVRIAAALAWLNANPGWFLILDNVDTEEAAAAAEELLAKLSGGHVLITGRTSNFSAGVETLELDVLTVDAAASFLLDRTKGKRTAAPDDEQQARLIAEELGQLALGLEQAGAYIEKNRIGFARYLKLWRETRKKVLEWFDPRLMKYPRGVAITWATSVERLTPESRRLLDRLAWLAPEPIPESLLDVEIPPDEGAGQEGAKPSFDARDALIGLFDYSLATRSTTAIDSTALERAGTSFLIHRLVQDVTRQNQAEARPAALAETVTWLRSAFRGDPVDVRNWPVLVPLEPHADAVVSFGDEREVAPTARAALMVKLAYLAFTKARYQQGEALLQRALAIYEAICGPDHPHVATSLNDLAVLFRETNRWIEAEQLSRRALAVRKAWYGPDHPDVAESLGNLAVLLQETNRFAEAERLSRRALAILEASYHSNHPDIAFGLNTLGGLLCVTNRLEEAEPLLRRALAISEQSYGPDNPKIVPSLNNLAGLLLDSNKLKQSEPLLRRTIEILETSYGPDHPDVATALNNLAFLLDRTNRVSEAEPLFGRSLAITEAVLGPQHPSVSKGLNNLGLLLSETDRFAEAEPLLRRALAIAERSCGPYHSQVATSLNNLGHLLGRANRSDEAEPLLRRALAIDEQNYGSNHPEVAVNLNNLGLLFHRTKRSDEAEQLFRQSLTIREASYGPDHPDVATGLANLASLLSNTNRSDEAEPLFRRAMGIYEANYGPDHPETIASIRHLAILLLRDTKRFREAEPLYRRAAIIVLKSFGRDHPETEGRVSDYRSALLQNGRTEEEAAAAIAEVEREAGIAPRPEPRSETP